MIVCANNGNFPANNTEELKTALNAACGEIWLGEGVDTYPCIAILCCEDGASLNYFASEGGDMYVSAGDKSQRGVIDVNIDGEVYQIERSQILPFENVLLCAEEFMKSTALPSCVAWEKL
ncbi:MAG: Imm1 family immunity protein [Oscillospiraceae bacterium]